jgi:predicted nucleic acid-binding protein
VIVADTGAIVALLDRDEANHKVLARYFGKTGAEWVIPSVVLPEVDYLLATRVGERVRRTFLADIVAGDFNVVWNSDADLRRAVEIHITHEALGLGLVDAMVMAVAERYRAEAIATLDLKHFGNVRLRYTVRIVPRDL